jgi:DNA-directed RNA polymerase subunit E'/Rpb7
MDKPDTRISVMFEIILFKRIILEIVCGIIILNHL